MIYNMVESGDEVLDKRLLRAASGDKASMVKRLAESGASLQNTNNEGNTPLMIAVDNENWTAVKYLQDKTSDFNIKNKFGHNVIMMLVMRRTSLPQRQKTLLHILNSNKHLIDISATDKDNKNCLHHAAHNSIMISALLKVGANPGTQDIDGNTPLMIALINKMPTWKDLAAGGHINCVNKKGETALCLAADTSNVEALSYLLQRSDLFPLGVSNFSNYLILSKREDYHGVLTNENINIAHRSRMAFYLEKFDSDLCRHFLLNLADSNEILTWLLKHGHTKAEVHREEWSTIINKVKNHPDFGMVKEKIAGSGKLTTAMLVVLMGTSHSWKNQ